MPPRRSRPGCAKDGAASKKATTPASKQNQSVAAAASASTVLPAEIESLSEKRFYNNALLLKIADFVAAEALQVFDQDWRNWQEDMNRPDPMDWRRTREGDRQAETDHARSVNGELAGLFLRLATRTVVVVDAGRREKVEVDAALQGTSSSTVGDIFLLAAKERTRATLGAMINAATSADGAAASGARSARAGRRGGKRTSKKDTAAEPATKRRKTNHLGVAVGASSASALQLPTELEDIVCSFVAPFPGSEKLRSQSQSGAASGSGSAVGALEVGSSSSLSPVLGGTDSRPTPGSVFDRRLNVFVPFGKQHRYRNPKSPNPSDLPAGGKDPAGAEIFRNRKFWLRVVRTLLGTKEKEKRQKSKAHAHRPVADEVDQKSVFLLDEPPSMETVFMEMYREEGDPLNGAMWLSGFDRSHPAAAELKKLVENQSRDEMRQFLHDATRAFDERRPEYTEKNLLDDWGWLRGSGPGTGKRSAQGVNQKKNGEKTGRIGPSSVSPSKIQYLKKLHKKGGAGNESCDAFDGECFLLSVFAALDKVDSDLLHDPRFAKPILSDLMDASTRLNGCLKDAFPHLGPAVHNDADFLSELVETDASVYKSIVAFTNKPDKAVTLAAVCKDPGLLKHVPEDCRDLDVCTEAMRRAGGVTFLPRRYDYCIFRRSVCAGPQVHKKKSCHLP